jgi:carboxyl-terminal processing protease
VNIDLVGIPPDRVVSFPEFTEADAGQLNALINSGKIVNFVQINPEAGSQAVDSFARQLNTEYGLDTVLLRRLIRNELNRRTIAPIYDLEYDVQLQEAVKILREENFRALMQTTKTLKALQEEAAENDRISLAS